MNTLVHVVRFCCSVLSIAIRLMLTAMFLIFIALIVTRYFFSYSPPWSEEISRFLLIWISMLGASVLVLYQDHFALHMLVERLSAKAQLYHSFVMQTVTLVICAAIFDEAVDFATSAIDVIAPGSQISMFYPKLAIPVGLALMMFFAAVSLVDIGLRIRGARGSVLPPQILYMASTFRPSDEPKDDDQMSSNAGTQG